jgi:hypothetical protein
MEWLFWYLFGLASGGTIIYLILNLKQKDIKMKWYEWVLGILTVSIAALMVENFVHSLAEMQVKAAWMGVSFMGVPAILLAAITVRSVQSRMR